MGAYRTEGSRCKRGRKDMSKKITYKEILEALENGDNLDMVFCEKQVNCIGCLLEKYENCNRGAKKEAARILKNAIDFEVEYEDGTPVVFGDTGLAWPSGMNYTLNEIAYRIGSIELRACGGGEIFDSITIAYGEKVKRKELDTQEKIDQDTGADPFEYCRDILHWRVADLVDGKGREARRAMILDLLRRQRELEVK